MKKVFSFLAAAFMAVSMFAAPYTITFKGTGVVAGSDGSAKLTTLEAIVAEGASYLSAVENATQIYEGRSVVYGESDTVSLGLKLGSSSAAGTLKLVLATATEVDSVVVRAALYGDTEGQNGFTVNGQQVTLSAGNKVLENKAVVLTGSVAAIEIIQTTASRGRFYMQSVTVYPKEGGSTTPAGTTVITAEKLWSNPIANMTAVADARQGSGYNGTVYVQDKGAHTVWAYAKTGDAVTKTAVATSDLLDGTAIAVDEAGNIIVEGVFPNTPSHLAVIKAGEDTVRNFEHAGLGRTDFISATGDIFSAAGGYVYLYSNSAKAQAVHFVNGAIDSVAVIESIATAATGGQVVYAGTPESYIAQVRASALQFVGRDAVTLPNIYNSKLGLDVFTIAGKEVYAYNVGTAYNSYFQLYNATDDALIPDMEGATMLFGVDPTKAQSTSCANWLRATVIDENNVYVHQYCGSDGAALWKISAVQAAIVTLAANDAAMGTVEGAGNKAINSSVTVTATPAIGHSFVAWKNGEETVSTDATYTFTATDNVSLVAVFQAEENKTLTLAVNDAELGAITLPEGVVMGENSVAYGTEVVLTAVPAEGKTFTGWYLADGAAYSTEYTITVKMTEALSLVANFTSIVTITYELNGGVTNDEGWISKADVMLSIQEDYNVAYNATLAVVKEENGEFYFNINGEWKTEAEAAGSDALVAGFFQNKTWSADQKCANLFLNTKKDKYAWLVDLIDHFAPTANAARGTDSIHNMAIATADAYFRADVSGFMLCSPATGAYPYTCDWSVNGTHSAILPVWKHAFANPTEIKGEVVLNAPYKEGFTFDGWYATADFSGEKVLSVNTATTATTLYAKWIEYIPTIAEVCALENNATTKVDGTVTAVIGSEFFIQDATGGVMCYQSNHGLAVGEAVRLQGTKVIYGGVPELKNITVLSHEAGTAIIPTVATIAQLKAAPATYNGKLVKLVGVKIDSYKVDSKNNYTIGLTDDINKINMYKVTLDSVAYPVGTKLSATLVLSSYISGQNEMDTINANSIQLRGTADGIEAVAAAGRDPYTYTTYKEGENEYKLENAWLFSQKLDNFVENMPAGDQMARAMGVKDGIMYFPDRQNMQIVRVNGATGKMMEPVKLASNIFTETLYAGTDSAKTVATRATLLNNDLKFDNAGHMLLGVCTTSGTQTFQVWNVNETTGEGTCVLSDIIVDHKADLIDTANVAKARFDYFGVYGDVTADAIIMTSDQFTMNVYKWTIKNGVVTGVEDIDCKVAEGVDAYIAGVVASGTGPQVFPVDEDYFYMDGWNTIPTLFDMDGELAGDMKSNPLGNNVPMDGDTIQIGVGHNGICEFQVADDYFVVMAATNTAAAVPSAFALYKYADASKDFATMTPLWFFPQAGMGGASNGVRTAVPSVEVSGNVANIYVYTQMNGYGRYTLTCPVKTAVENIATDVKAEKIIENGQVYIIRNGVRYSVLGARVK